MESIHAVIKRINTTNHCIISDWYTLSQFLLRNVVSSLDGDTQKLLYDGIFLLENVDDRSTFIPKDGHMHICYWYESLYDEFPQTCDCVNIRLYIQKVKEAMSTKYPYFTIN